jgi:hypothetical protein
MERVLRSKRIFGIKTHFFLRLEYPSQTTDYPFRPPIVCFSS